MSLYVDYMQGRSKWQRCQLDEIGKYRTEEDFFITWQRYCNDLRGEYGEIFGNWPFDFDHEVNLDIARQDCFRVYCHFISAGVKPENIRLFFSGNKGFHLELDYRAYMDKPCFDLHLIYHELYFIIEKWLKPEKHSSTLDGSIYSIRRMWRYPNTRHSTTGLYCVPLSAVELQLPISEILKLAKTPRQGFIEKFVKDPILLATFKDARTKYYKHIESFEKRKILIGEYTGAYPPCITKMIAEGLPSGSRNNTIYLLARFMKEFKKEDEIYTTLSDLAQKSGMTDIKEARSTIFSALKREGSYVSCRSLFSWCNQEKCDLFTKKENIGHHERVEKTFNSYTYQESLKLLKLAIANGEYSRVMRTGILQLDSKTKILQDSLIVIGSLSDAGKTSFAITIVRNNQDKRILYLGIEEGRDRTALRLWKTGISENTNITIHTGKLGEITPLDIYSLAYKNSGNFDFMIIDQLVNLTDLSKEERLKYKKIMEKLREIAREFKKPIFVLHQLNRLSRFDKGEEPCKEQLAEGADIERLAYDIWLLYRRKGKDNKIYSLLKIDKNKNYKSPIIIPLDYNFKTNIFKDYPHDWIDWEIITKLGIDDHEYYHSQMEEDIKL
ncbi:MAG: DnaB-like helicase C-terminal domain-containing protein [bacterium]